ncbi:MAG: hypothetical protein NTY22_06705 [Proteobacteria bacterium]|nr:hypothetical protein [Pseudomonadota bacterium]
MASAKGFINSTLDLFKKSSSIAKLMMKKSIMERSRKQKFQHLGELTYALYKTDVIKDMTLKDHIEEIDNINKDIRQTSGELSGFVYVDKNQNPNL